MSEEAIELTENQKIELNIREAFDSAIASGKDEEDVKMDMLGAGAKFKNVTRYFNEFMIDSGMIKSKKEKDEILHKVLSDVDLTDPETFDSCIAELIEELDATEKSATASLRQWAKKEGVEFYKKPKGAGTGRSGITAKVLNWISENPVTSNEDLVDYLKEVGTENTIRNKTFFIGVLDVARKIVKNYE